MGMADQLIWVEALIKGATGILLVLFPIWTAKLLGLPITPTGFWGRLVGALLVGMAVALWIEGAWRPGQGLGLAGVLAINLTTGAILVVMLSGRGAAPRPRGRAALWLAVALLMILAGLELIALLGR